MLQRASKGCVTCFLSLPSLHLSFCPAPCQSQSILSIWSLALLSPEEKETLCHKMKLERVVQILSKVDCTFVNKNIIWSCIILSHKYNPLGHKLITNRLDKGMSSGSVLLPVMSDKLCYFPYRSTDLQSKWSFNLLEQHDKEEKTVRSFQERWTLLQKAPTQRGQGSGHSAGVTFQMTDSFQI